MLGKNCPTSSEAKLTLGTLICFSIAENLLVDKRRSKTCLNGESSSISSLFFDKFNLNYCHKFYCQNLSLEDIFNNNDNLSKNSETITNNPVPNRIAPRQLPGVYIILCLANNKRYYGESTNISFRLSNHKSRLRRNIHEVCELQRDWNLYGENLFELSPLYMSKDCNKFQREALELEYIAQNFDICYNKFAKSSRKKQNNPFWGRKHTEVTRKQIGRSIAENNKMQMPAGLTIRLKGEIYPSISEASRQTNHSRDTIRRWLNDPYNNSCQRIDVSQAQPRYKEIESAEFAIKKEEQLNTGLSKPVSLDGIPYPSIAEAARKFNCSRANIQRRLRTDEENCFFL